MVAGHWDLAVNLLASRPRKASATPNLSPRCASVQAGPGCQKGMREATGYVPDSAWYLTERGRLPTNNRFLTPDQALGIG